MKPEIIEEIQKYVGKCTQYCKFYKCSNEMYCEHPLIDMVADFSLEHEMGVNSPCIFWESNIQFCTEHSNLFIPEIQECPDCFEENRKKQEKQNNCNHEHSRTNTIFSSLEHFNWRSNKSACKYKLCQDCKNRYDDCINFGDVIIQTVCRKCGKKIEERKIGEIKW